MPSCAVLLSHAAKSVRGAHFRVLRPLKAAMAHEHSRAPGKNAVPPAHARPSAPQRALPCLA